MRLSDICVQRPVFAFMLISFLVVMGIFSFFRIGVDLFPRSDPATIYVMVRLPGASPEEVTSQVVMPLEEAIASVSGIDEMRAMVSEGNANLTITFVLERDIYEAADDVREKVSGAMRDLPPNVLPPVVQKADPDSDPVITLVVSGQRSTRELTEIADKQIRRALETVDGVAGVDITGGQKRQINVFLESRQAKRLQPDGAGRGARAAERKTSRRRAAASCAVRPKSACARWGAWRTCRSSTTSSSRTWPARPSAFATSAMPKTAPRSGAASPTTKASRRSSWRFAARPAPTPCRWWTASKPAWRCCSASCRRASAIDEVKDQADYIRNSVKSLEEHLVLGSLLASMIVWLFIRNWRTVLISSHRHSDFDRSPRSR